MRQNRLDELSVGMAMNCVLLISNRFCFLQEIMRTYCLSVVIKVYSAIKNPKFFSFTIEYQITQILGVEYESVSDST